MNLALVPAVPGTDIYTTIARINDEAFPDSERRDLDDIYAFAAATGAELLGIYDRDEDTIVGFVMLLANAECGYLNYIAIDHRYRSQGYGATAIQCLRERYPQIQLMLDFEPLDPDTDNYEQRVRRKEFYLRNGFHETGCYTMVGEERYELVCTDGPLRREAFMDLLRTIHADRPDFPAALF